MGKELEIFKSEEFGEVRTVQVKDKIYFVGNDVAKALGYSRPRDAVHKHCKKSLKIEMKTSGGSQKMSCIKLEDVYLLIQKSMTVSEKYKKNFIQWISKDERIKDDNLLVICSRKEIEFLDKLEQFLLPFDIKGIKQYNILNYKIDYYIPSLNIAVEYDENNHKNYTYKQQEYRQEEIKNELGCEFIRVSDENTDEYNIGHIIKSILNIREVA